MGHYSIRIVYIFFFFGMTICCAQNVEPSTTPFSSDNGFKGEALLETKFFFEDTFKLKIMLKELTITGYQTSIGFFSYNDLMEYGINFPFVCDECSFNFSINISAYFSKEQEWVDIPITTNNVLMNNGQIVLNVPFDQPNTAARYQKAIIDWEKTGEISVLKLENLTGDILTKVNSIVKTMAKKQIDSKRYRQLLMEIEGLDQEKSIQQLFWNRSQFYDKQQIDSLILAIKNNGPINPVEALGIANNTSIISYKKEKSSEPIQVQPRPSIAKTEISDMPIELASPDNVEPKLETSQIPINDTAFEQTTINLCVENNEEPNRNLETSSLKTISETGLDQIANSKNSTVNKDEKVSLVELIAHENENSQLSELVQPEENEPKGDVVEKHNKKVDKLSNLTKDDFDFSTDLTQYKRSSLHTIMLQNPGEEQTEVIQETFLNRPLPEKFNNHDVGINFIKVFKKARRQEQVISEYLERENLAKDLVAKWFNRNEKGEFNMDLIAERGHYNATVFDLNIARKSERGLAMLADAGEQLIANTFVIVNDYKYTNKEEVAKKTGFLSSIVSAVATAAGADDVALIADATTVATGVAGKGYVVKVTSYLYRLKWNEKIANTFYEKFWVDANNFDLEKKRAFDRTDLFQLELVGLETDFSATQSSIFTSKTDAELIQRATIKATDQTIAKLQRKFQIFRTVTPLVGTEPLAAQIGLKEGVEKGDKFEVLEQFLNDDGSVGLNRVGVIKVDKNRIWDNRYRAAYEEDTNSSLEFTQFSGGKEKYYPGMLIRQIN